MIISFLKRNYIADVDLSLIEDGHCHNNLINVDFTGANLSGVNLTNAKFKGVIIKDAKCIGVVDPKGLLRDN